MKCYYASFNVGNVEAWQSELFLDKDSVFSDVENSIEDIADAIEDFSFLEKNEIITSINYAILKLKQYGIYKEKENNFDFFILEQPVWKNIKEYNSRENYGINN